MTSSPRTRAEAATSSADDAPAPRAILHLDMDAFYASVEQRDDPALRGRPVIVASGTLAGSHAPRDELGRAKPVLAHALDGHARRGVVLAASYEVRPFGVRSAMPMARALQMAPGAIVVPPRHDVYAEVSGRVFEILASVTPLVEPLSLDEAFLDVTASRKLFGAPAEVAARLRARIAAEVGLPASAGIAEVKLVAKIASDLAKPNGQLEVPAGGGAAFLAPLPVSRLWGVGPKSARELAAMGLETCGDVAGRDPAALARRLGPSGRSLWEQANAIDPRPVVPDRDAKSIGAEDTFDEDLTDAAALSPRIHAQALRVGQRLRAAGLRARTVQLKLKRADYFSGTLDGSRSPRDGGAQAELALPHAYTLVTRRATLDEATDDGQQLYRQAAALLAREPARPTRLTGVSAQNLVPAAAAQANLFAPPPTAAQALNRALDAIADRFGAGTVTTADVADDRE